MGKTSALITGLVVGVVVGFVVGRLIRPTVTCDPNHLIRITATTAALPDTCVSKAAGDQIRWEGTSDLTLTLAIPDPPGGPNPYPSPNCQSSVCQSGTLVAGTIPDGTSIHYSLTVRSLNGSRPIYGHIIIKP
jgi:hypothetical protein